MDLKKLNNYFSIESTISDIIDDLKQSAPDKPETKIRYPGENVVATRNENLQNGISVNKQIWEEIKKL